MILFVLAAVWAQAAGFDAASVKVSARLVGKDANNQVVVTPTGWRGKNVTLKYLIGEAYGVQPFQVTGGPGWLDGAEYEVEAKLEREATREEMRPMLRALLERFRLAVHSDSKEMRVYELTVDKGGPKLQAAAGGRRFHGEMREFANLLSVQLSIPAMDDPGRPGMASGAPVPVIDKTGIAGVQDFGVEVRPEPGGDMFTLWQRVLREQLGLRLESHRGKVDVVVVDGAERAPAAPK